MNIHITKDLLKSQVKVMREFLKEGFCEKCHTATSITQSAAYNLIAKMYGKESWNILSSLLKEGE